MWNIRGIWSFFIRHVSTMFTLDWSVSPSVTEVNCQIKKAFNYEVMVWDTVTLKCAVGIVPMFQRSPSPAWLHTFWTTVAHCVHSVERGHVLLCQSQTPLQFGSSSCRRFCLTWKGRMHRSQKDSVKGEIDHPRGEQWPAGNSFLLLARKTTRASFKAASCKGRFTATQAARWGCSSVFQHICS